MSATCESTHHGFEYENKTAVRSGTGHVTDNSIIPFPWKLYSILEEAETNQQLHSIISWFPNGYGFMVHDANQFFEKIMKKHFHTQSRFQSFTRQLYIYGFSKLSDDSGPYYGGFFHPQFTRQDKESHLKITRNTKGRADRRYKKPQQPKKKQAEKQSCCNTVVVKQTVGLPSMAQYQAAVPLNSQAGSHSMAQKGLSSTEMGDVDDLINSTLSIIDQAISVTDTDPQQGQFSDLFFPDFTDPMPSMTSSCHPNNNEDNHPFSLEDLEPRLIEEMMIQFMK